MKVNFHTENYTGCLCDAFPLHPAIHHETDQRGQHVRQEGTISIWLIFQIKHKQKSLFQRLCQQWYTPLWEEIARHPKHIKFIIYLRVNLVYGIKLPHTSNRSAAQILVPLLWLGEVASCKVSGSVNMNYTTSYSIITVGARQMTAVQLKKHLQSLWGQLLLLFFIFLFF